MGVEKRQRGIKSRNSSICNCNKMMQWIFNSRYGFDSFLLLYRFDYNFILIIVEADMKYIK